MCYFCNVENKVTKTLILVLALMVNCVAWGKGLSEQDHVLVTLNDGTKIEGYVTKYWSEPSTFSSMNRVFWLASGIDGNNPKRYSADEVKSIDFIVKISDRNYEHVISAEVANPSTFKPHRSKKQFVHIEDSTSRGVIYWWNAIDSQQMQLGAVTMSTIYGVCFEGENIIVPFLTGNVISLNALRITYKKTERKDLVEYLDKRILKGGSKLWNEVPRNPMMFMDFVEEYYSKAKP